MLGLLLELRGSGRLFEGMPVLLLALATEVLYGWAMLQSTRRLATLRPGWPSLTAMYMLYAAVCIGPMWIGDENLLFMLAAFLIVFQLCCEGSRLSRLVMSVVLYLLQIPVSMVLDTFFVWSWTYRIAILSALKALFAVLIWALLRKLTQPGKQPKLPPRLWGLCGLLATAPLFAVLVFSIWNGFVRYPDEKEMRLAYTVLPFVELSAAALVAALIELSRQQELEQTHQLAGMRELYYQGLQTQQTQLRTLRHDLRNHLTAAQGLFREGSGEQAAAYLAELTDSPAFRGSGRVCENETANVVLSSKREQMEEQGLTADFLATLPRGIPMADIDLCALLGNGLDNAMEAAQKAADKTISLRLRADRGMLMLRIENAYQAEPQREGDRFCTGKADKAAHGFGMAGMQEIVHRYGGQLEATARKGKFELVACVPLEEIPKEAEH